jgi:hypothetical protein
MDSLIIRKAIILWLCQKLWLEFMNCFESSLFNIHFENLSSFAKKHLFWFCSCFKINEEVFHTDTLKERNLFYDNPIHLLKGFFSSIFMDIDFEEKQLVLSLVIHYKILTTDACNPSLTFRFADTNYLIWFSSFSFQ